MNTSLEERSHSVGIDVALDTLHRNTQRLPPPIHDHVVRHHLVHAERAHACVSDGGSLFLNQHLVHTRARMAGRPIVRTPDTHQPNCPLPSSRSSVSCAGATSQRSAPCRTSYGASRPCQRAPGEAERTPQHTVETLIDPPLSSLCGPPGCGQRRRMPGGGSARRPGTLRRAPGRARRTRTATGAQAVPCRPQ